MLALSILRTGATGCIGGLLFSILEKWSSQDLVDRG